MRNICLLILAFCSIHLAIHAQQTKGTAQVDPNYNPYEEKTSYTMYEDLNRIMRAYEPMSYFSPIVLINPMYERVVEPQEGEAENDRYLFEASVRNIYPIFRGREHHSDFLQTGRITVNLGIDIRMALDSSKPLLPGNYKIGIGIEKVLYDNKMGWHLGLQKKEVNTSSWTAGQKAWTSWNWQLIAQHYSNGQAPGFYFIDENGNENEKRHDWRGGDFSTNYIRNTILWNRVGPKNSLLTVGLGYQIDGSRGDNNVAYSVEQEGSYGFHRAQLLVQYRTKPFITGIRRWRDHRKEISVDTVIENSRRVKVVKQKKYWLQIYRMSTLRFRLESDLIMDETPNHPRGNNDRFGVHFYTEYSPLRYRSLGYMVHFYYGRDYFNIRYDDVIAMVQVGLTFTFKRYNPIGWRPKANELDPTQNDNAKIKVKKRDLGPASNSG